MYDLSLSFSLYFFLSFSCTHTQHTIGVLRAAGGALGLNAMAENSAKDKKAKPLNQAIGKFLTAKNPKTAWSHAIVSVCVCVRVCVCMRESATEQRSERTRKRMSERVSEVCVMRVTCVT